MHQSHTAIIYPLSRPMWINAALHSAEHPYIKNPATQVTATSLAYVSLLAASHSAEETARHTQGSNETPSALEQSNSSTDAQESQAAADLTTIAQVHYAH